MNENVQIIIFTEDRIQAEKYLKLFTFMLRGDLVSVKNSAHERIVQTSEFRIKIMTAGQMARGHRAHYVMNLTQDKEFDSLVARPIERFAYLDQLEDPKWRNLF